MDVPGRARPNDPEPRPPGVERQEQEAADAQHLQQLERVRRARLGKLTVVVVIVIGLVVFALQNSQPAQVRVLFATIHPRLVWVLLTCAIVGGIVGGVVGYLTARPSRNVRLHGEPPHRRPGRPVRGESNRRPLDVPEERR
jgi:uncharacterized integral membrane protein